MTNPLPWLDTSQDDRLELLDGFLREIDGTG
jgi:hypothetical protein